MQVMLSSGSLVDSSWKEEPKRTPLSEGDMEASMVRFVSIAVACPQEVGAGIIEGSMWRWAMGASKQPRHCELTPLRVCSGELLRTVLCGTSVHTSWLQSMGSFQQHENPKSGCTAQSQSVCQPTSLPCKARPYRKASGRLRGCWSQAEAQGLREGGALLCTRLAFGRLKTKPKV